MILYSVAILGIVIYIWSLENSVSSVCLNFSILSIKMKNFMKGGLENNGVFKCDAINVNYSEQLPKEQQRKPK